MRLGLGASRRRVWVVSAAILVVAAAALGTAALAGGHAATPETAASTTSTVRRGTVAMTASAAGTVQATATRGLSFSMAGTVSEVDVKAGDTVSAGQVLAKIDDTDAQTAVDNAQSQVNSAQDAVAKAAADASAAPTTGSGSCQVAPAGYTSGSPSPSATATPGGSPSATPSGPASPRGSTGGTGSGPGTGNGRNGTGGCGSAGSTGTGSTGRNGGAGGDPLFSAQQQLNNAQLALQQAQRKLAGTVLTAPIAGKVLSVAGVVGSTETPGNNGFIVLGGLADTEVAAQFTETDVAHLAVGQPATITLPDRSGQSYSGKVSQVSPVGTASGRLVRYTVLIAFDEVPPDLLYGQSADVVVTTQSVTNVLYVSSSAVTGIQGSTGTVTVRSGGHDERRTVQIGLRGDRYTEIRSGLSQGDTVVVGGG